MTTMLAYNWQGTIDYASLCFNPDEPDVPPDAMLQNPVLDEIKSILALRFTNKYRRSDVFLDSNTFICYDRRNLNVRVAPDLYITFGVDANAIRDRRIYLPWEAGKPPDIAFEFASDTTSEVDMEEKPAKYAQSGIPEYWRLDPTGGDLYGQPLAGERLVNGIYRPIELTTEPDGVLKGYSAAIDLCLCWHEDWFYVYDPVTREYLKNFEQVRDDLLAEQAARQDAETALLAEQAAREADQARIRQLEEELRRRESEG